MRGRYKTLLQISKHFSVLIFVSVLSIPFFAMGQEVEVPLVELAASTTVADNIATTSAAGVEADIGQSDGEVLGATTESAVGDAAGGGGSSISVDFSFITLNDLVYEGSPESVGLTPEPLANMQWWGIVVESETENFISTCVSTDIPLPVAVFNLNAGEYRAELSLAETKADCETFNQNAYPLFVVFETANLSVK